ncbi:MAG TPA: hypothetical protein VKU35_05325 [Candidatus Limnocylindria bacterium]|nr:hypothetical protein [Candidatus Limnocylindria bacterium]
MSRGRPRHQASRRRTYSARQRELKDRRGQLALEQPTWLEESVSFEIDEGLDFESPTSWGVRLHGRPTAA